MSDLSVPDKKTAYDPTTFPFADPVALNLIPMHRDSGSPRTD